MDDAISKGIIAHPSHPSYAGSLADFVYGNEDKREEFLPNPNKIKESHSKIVAPVKNQTKTIKKRTPLMNMALKMARRK